MAPEADDDRIDLRQYVRALQRRWKLALFGAILGGAVGFGLASARPLRYEGVTTLLVVPPTQSSGTQITPATFRAIVENATLASQVIQELQLKDFTPQAFLEQAVRVDEVRGTNLVKVKVTLPDPKAAAEAAHRLAMKAIALTQQVNQQGGASIQEQLKNHLNDARERLEKAEQDLLSYKQRAQVELVKGDAVAQLKERGDLLELVINIEAERARLAAAVKEIDRQQPLLSVPRFPGAEDALRRSMAPVQAAEDPRRSVPPVQGAEDPRQKKPSASTSTVKDEVDPQHLDLTNPFVNPVYQTLDFQIATTRTRIAALEKRRDEVMNVKKLGGKELGQLSELYRREIEQARLQASFDLATRVYGDLGLRYEQSRTQPVGNTAQLQLIDDALPPDRPVARKRLQFGVFGAALGLVGAVLIGLLWDSRSKLTPQLSI